MKHPAVLFLSLPILWVLLLILGSLLITTLGAGGPGDLRARFEPPCLGPDCGPVLGRDHLGRNLVPRLARAVQYSLVFALFGSLIGCVVGTFLGFVASLKTPLRTVILSIIDWQIAVPFFIVALALVAAFGYSLVVFLIVVGINGWEVYARLVSVGLMRGRQVALRETFLMDNVPPARIFLKHQLPRLAGSIIIAFTLNVPGTMLLESTLSFLGLGIQPPNTSLGLMVAQGRAYLLNAPHLVGIPAGIIVLTTLSLSLIGDSIHSRINPQPLETGKNGPNLKGRPLRMTGRINSLVKGDKRR